MKKKIMIFIAVLVSVSLFMLTPTFAYSNEIFYNDEKVVSPMAKLNESFTYTSKQVSSFTISTSIPSYTNNNLSLKNCCACVAGAIAIGYYDRFNENLVPNYQTYRIIRDKILYKSLDATTQSIINQLYVDMGTNTISAGTNETQFLNGIRTYVGNRGYSLSTNSIISGGKIDVSALDRELRAGHPVAILVSKYNTLYNYTDNGSTVSIGKSTIEIAHIMMVYGYENVKYYNGSNNFKTNLYLRLATGNTETTPLATSLVDSSMIINNSYGMVIA